MYSRTWPRFPPKTGPEQDCIHRGWRKRLCYMDKPGVTASIKRQMRRRERYNRQQSEEE